MNTKLKHWDLVAVDWLTALAILGVFLLAALLLRLLWSRLLTPLLRVAGINPDNSILLPLRRLVLWAVFFSGLYYAAGSLDAVHDNTRAEDLLARALGVVWAVLALWTLVRLFNEAALSYTSRAMQDSGGGRDLTDAASLVRKVVTTVALVVGVLYVLRVAGVDISPLLASAGIGGIAVALAAQDTLSNLLAGFFLTIDRPVRLGDFVKLQSGEEGHVEEIGWRYTRIRTLAYAAVIIPNSKFSQTLLTNFEQPGPEISIMPKCGVAYGTSLERAEELALEVAAQIQQEVEGAVPGWEPKVRWQEFGDYAVTFVTILRVRSYDAQFLVKSEFVKALYRRYGQEGIDIPFPVQTVILADGKEAKARRQDA